MFTNNPTILHFKSPAEQRQGVIAIYRLGQTYVVSLSVFMEHRFQFEGVILYAQHNSYLTTVVKVTRMHCVGQLTMTSTLMSITSQHEVGFALEYIFSATYVYLKSLYLNIYLKM